MREALLACDAFLRENVDKKKENVMAVNPNNIIDEKVLIIVRKHWKNMLAVVIVVNQG